jgi:superfamily II DNA/RNA helicase
MAGTPAAKSRHLQDADRSENKGAIHKEKPKQPMSFSSLGLSEKVLSAVTAAGYTEPTPIQAQAIPSALQGRDILGIAQTGTGKTAAFVLPMLSRLETGRARARMPRTLILEPTRELAAQVEENFIKYGVNHKLNVALLIGGVSFGDQEQKIMRGADVLIATPGRLLDFFERGKLLLNGIDILVIDEADRMLDMGFIPDIEKICKMVPFTRQTLFFSATMPPEITRLTQQFLQNPQRIEVARVGATAASIKQSLVASHPGRDKRETLRKLIRGAENFRNAIIFANRKRDVAILQKSLTTHGFSAGALHGDMDQSARMASLEAFKNGDVSLLVCSDVAARGLDIPDVSHVFNFDIPTHPDDYVHRIGRTGRAGKSGVAKTICLKDEQKYIDQIEKLTDQTIEWEGPKFDELDEPTDFTLGKGRSSRSPRARTGRSRTGRDRDPNQGRGARRDAILAAAAEREADDHDDSDIVENATAGEAQDGDRSKEKRPRKRRSERKRSEERDQVVETAAEPDVSEDDAAEGDMQKRQRRPRKDRNEASGRERQPRENSRREQGREQQRRYRDDTGPSPIGFGDHMPAFLARPIPSRASRKEQAAAEE